MLLPEIEPLGGFREAAEGRKAGMVSQEWRVISADCTHRSRLFRTPQVVGVVSTGLWGREVGQGGRWQEPPCRRAKCAALSPANSIESSGSRGVGNQRPPPE